MRLATWNINGLRARFEFLLHWLRERRPDLVGLQELKLEDDRFPRLELEAEGYQAITHGQKAWNGVAILSRHPLEELQAGLPGQADFGARLVTARTDALDFTTVYCPNGKHVEHDDYPRKLAWFDSLAEHLADRDSERPYVICGDFNICPEPIDSWSENPERIFHTPDERRRFRALLDQGLVDLYRDRYPDEQKFSWWDYRGGSFHRNMGLRIDFLLGNAALSERVTEVWIDRDYRKKKDGLTASDHAPVIAELD